MQRKKGDATQVKPTGPNFANVVKCIVIDENPNQNSPANAFKFQRLVGAANLQLAQCCVDGNAMSLSLASPGKKLAGTELQKVHVIVYHVDDVEAANNFF